MLKKEIVCHGTAFNQRSEQESGDVSENAY